MTLALEEAREQALTLVRPIVSKWKEMRGDDPTPAMMAQLLDVVTTHLLKTKTNRKEIESLIEVDKLYTSLSKEELVDMIVTSGALLKGHFELLSGMHSDIFFKFSRIAGKSHFRERICSEIVEKFKNSKIDIVLGPISGGGLMVPPVAKGLGVAYAYAEVGIDGRPAHLQKQFSIAKKERVLILHDLITTGKSVENLVQITKSSKGVIAGMGVFATRGKEGEKAAERLRKQGVDIHVLMKLNVKNIDPSECELDGKYPITRSRDIYL